MNFFRLILAALVLLVSSVAAATAATPEEKLEAAAKAAAEARAEMTTEKAVAQAQETARRAGRSYGEWIRENATFGWQYSKAGACAAASVVTTADGYAAYPLAVLSTKFTEGAFGASRDAWSAAESAAEAAVPPAAREIAASGK